jgi:hypothetical protein
MNCTSWRPLAAAIAVLASTGCYREVIRTFDIRVPQMKSQAAADIVERTIRSFDTNIVVAVKSDPGRHVVTVTYNSERAARRNFEQALVLAGFDANDLTADPARKAQLPPEMQ